MPNKNRGSGKDFQSYLEEAKKYLKMGVPVIPDLQDPHKLAIYLMECLDGVGASGIDPSKIDLSKIDTSQ